MATVLIVDDRPVNRELVRTVLAFHGHDALEAPGGAEALRLLRDRAVDVVVAAVVMPGMDGYELARAIRADAAIPSLPVLFYTPNYVESEIRAIATQGAAAVETVVRGNGDLGELIDAVQDTLSALPHPVAADPSAAETDAPPKQPKPADEFSREHLRVLNAKLFEKVHELEEGARLHQMVEAIVAVGDDPSLPAILRRTASAAYALVDARHVSVVTVGSALRRPACVHVGDDREAARRVDAWAHASGPVDMSAFDFLVVPIHIGGEVFGNLVLRHSAAGGPFSSADLTLLQTLARAAGVAITNAQLYDDARQREQWLSETPGVAPALRAADAVEAGRLIARGARRVVGASNSWICVPVDDETVRVEASDGVLADALTGMLLPRAAAALFEDVAASSRPVVVADAGDDPRTRPLCAALDLQLGPLLAVPLRASGRSFGVLYVGADRGAAAFSRLDVEVARAFASRAAQTLDLARAEEHRERLTVAEDRNRIARDLHDVVIQRLFGVGLRLEQLRSQAGDTVGDALSEVIDDLDRTIDEIRNAIFSLRSIEAETSLRAQLIDVIEPAAQLLSHAPRLRLEGPLDRAVPEHVHPHVVATLGEAMSNVVRHAQATRVDVLVRVDGDGLTLRVSDNGRGLPPDRHESGLANLRRRAEDLGGTMRLSAGLDGRGLTMTWTVPLPVHETDVTEEQRAVAY